MSIRFAGSRCVDERRRRRLAQEADSVPEPPVRASRAKARDASTPAATPTSDRLPRGSSPADTLVSPRLWKHAAVGIVSLLAWGAVLLIGDSADRSATGLEMVVGLQAGKLTAFFSTVMLLAAGQLSFISLWYRSRSRKDFNGSYKLWFWTAVTWLTLSAFQGTGAHWSLADAVLAGRPVAIWNGRMMIWLVPAAIVAVALYRLLRREMRDCGESLWTLRLSAFTAAAATTAMLFGPFVFGARAQLLAEAGLGSLCHLLLAFAMLLHARHVIHTSNEPPQSELPRFRLRWPRLTLAGLRRSRAPSGKKISDAATPKSSRRQKAASKTKRKPASERSRATAEKLPPEDDAAEDANVETDDSLADEVDSPAETSTEEVESSRRRPAASPVAPAKLRVDPPQGGQQRQPHVMSTSTDVAETDSAADDSEDADDDLGGLSKKERRRLKKLQRQKSHSVR